MTRQASYIRPMAGWWRRDPFFVRYMAREATALFVVAYALILLATLANLARGRAAFEAWLEFLRSPVSLAIHAVLLVAFLWHAITWFLIMPKTMPPVVVAGRRVPARVITGAGLAAAAGASLVLFFVLRHDAWLGFERHWAGAGFTFVVVSLFLWHGIHRIFHSLHDLGVHARGAAAWACYGFASAGTLATAFLLMRL
jgi:fumarate reductase subunit C